MMAKILVGRSLIATRISRGSKIYRQDAKAAKENAKKKK
jgi:hypothetical protein